jgi:DNA-binding NarL/FixJ family response regulator
MAEDRTAIAGVLVVARGRILLVHEEEPSRADVEIALSDHQVVIVDDALQAVARLAEDAAFDLVIHDAAAPGMSPTQLRRELRQHFPALAGRLVFLTDGRQRGLPEQLLSAGALAVVWRPVTSEALRRLVAALLAAAPR